MTGQAPQARYRAYPAYKASGVEWLGDIPAGWGTCSLRWLAHVYSGGTPSKTVEEYWKNGTIPWLNSGSVNQIEISEPSTFISKNALANSSAKWIPENSLVLALAGQGKTKGTVAFTKIKTTCNQSMAAIVFGQRQCPKFFFWWLQSNYQNIRNMAGGDMRDGLNLELLSSIVCPTPALPEQTRIAAFLDHETLRIDALIDRQQRLIALLEEKRQAVISHAVTKGLNPDAPLRPSGIDWLGDVPAHWEVKPLKHLCIDGNGIQMGPFGGMLTKLEADDTGYKLFGQENTIKADFTLGERYISAIQFRELSRYKLTAGDLVLTRKGSIGNCQIFPEDAPLGIADSDTIRVKLDTMKAFPPFIRLCLSEADFIKVQLELNKRGAILSGLNTSVIANLHFALPSLEEQIEILDRLGAKNSKFGRAIFSAQSAITLLKERRTALISAAVTGKIDVRDWTPPEAKEITA